MQLAIMLLFCVFGITPTQQPLPDTEELRQLETEWNKAHVDLGVTLDQLLSDDIEVVAPGIIAMSKVEAHAYISAASIHTRRYESSDLRIRVYGDSAVVTGKIRRVRERLEPKLVVNDYRFTKVYVRQRGNWKIVSFHASDYEPVHR
jgi:hypothetical protein